MKQLIFTLLLFSFSATLFAENIDSYEINITIEQSGELSIVEEIDYNFGNQQRHGIFRDIPVTVKNKGRIKDIGVSNFAVKMDGANVQWVKSSSTSSTTGLMAQLKIGSPDTYVTGQHHYQIAYRVSKGVLPASRNNKHDAIRWNVIGTGWEIPISNVRANFFLPETLSQRDIDLSTFTGVYGSTKTSATTRWITPKHLQVKIASLQPHEGATAELAYQGNTLDQNGLENVKTTFWDWLLDYWQWGALSGFLVYLRRIWKEQFGASDKRSIAVQYKAPKGLSLLESGLILDKSADSKDFAAAILELAQLGYIKINQKDKRYKPTLVRTDKSTEGLGYEQKYLLDEVVFKKGKSYKMSKATSSTNALKKGFDYINENLYEWVVIDGYMEENPLNDRKRFLKKSAIFLLLCIALMALTFYLKYGPEILAVLIFPLVFGGIGLSLAFGTRQLFTRVFGLVFAGFGMIPLVVLVNYSSDLRSLLLSPLTIVAIIIGMMVYTYKKLGRYTPVGSKIHTHLLGLKTFIQRVKQDEIKRRLETDPLYLDRMLPYALLFDEADHWFSFYDDLNVSTPHWYHGNISSMRGFSTSVNKASTPPPSRSSGGGGYSGGGGSSGGGGGGGGGGSW